MNRIQSAMLGSITAALVLGGTSSAGVLVVAADGSGLHTSVQTAIDAALEGDTLLVRSGSYAGFTISNKSLVVTEEAGSSASITSTIVVSNLAAGRTVVLAGFAVTGVTTATIGDVPGTALVLSGNAGFVRAQSCSFQGAVGLGSGSSGSGECCTLPGHHWGWHGVVATDNPGGTAFVGCTLRGGFAANAYYHCYCGYGGAGGDGLRATNSAVALYDCTLAGGYGGGAGYGGGTGGAACHVQSAGSLSAVHASGSSFSGGRGGEGYDFMGSVGGAGGPALVIGAGAFAWSLENTLQGGAGGAACGGAFGYGPAGAPTTGPGSSFFFTQPRLKLSVPTAAGGTTSLPLTVHGRPGDRVFLYASNETHFALLPSWHGARLVHRVSAAPVMILGEIPANGVLTTWITPPALDAGEQARTLFLQAWRNSPIDGLTLGSFAVVTLLSPPF